MQPSVSKALLLVALLFVPAAAYADMDARAVAEKISVDLAHMHKQAETILLQTSANPIFNDFLTAPDPIKKRAAKDAVDQIMLSVSQKYHASEICLIGAGGPELARVDEGKIAQTLDPNEVGNEFFGPAMAQAPKTVYIVPPYISHDAGKWVVAYATPIAISGHTKAILHYEYSLEDYQIPVRQELYSHFHVVLVSADGLVLADNRSTIPVALRGAETRPEAYFKKFTMQGSDLDGIKNKLRGGIGRVGPNDKSVSVAWRTVPAGMTLIVAQDK